MKPDEHKRKKNAAYKKKHGITTETNDRKEEKTKKEAEKTSRDRKNEPPSKSFQAKSKINDLSSKMSVASSLGVRSKTKIENIYSESSSSDDEVQVETSSKKKPFKSFRRREIVSNWHKYELQPNEEENTPTRGENYEKLLSMAGETISHFRFKDELAWNDQADSTNEKSSDAYSQFLCVNPVELAQSLACLPVYQVLGVSHDVFPDDQLSSMAITTKERQSLYAAEEFLDDKGHEISPAGKDTSIEESYPPRLLSTQRDNQKELLSAIILKVHPDTLSDTPKQKIVNTTTSSSAPDATVDVHDNCSGSDIVSKEVLSSDSSNIIIKKSGEKPQLKDDDLDTLLDCEIPTAELTRDVTELTEDVTELARDVTGLTGDIAGLARDVTGLARDVTGLARDVTGASQNKPSIPDSVPKSDGSSMPSQPSTGGLVSKMVAESSDLEAWLDSILDD